MCRTPLWLWGTARWWVTACGTTLWCGTMLLYTPCPWALCSYLNSSEESSLSRWACVRLNVENIYIYIRIYRMFWIACLCPAFSDDLYSIFLPGNAACLLSASWWSLPEDSSQPYEVLWHHTHGTDPQPILQRHGWRYGPIQLQMQENCPFSSFVNLFRVNFIPRPAGKPMLGPWARP